MDATISYSYSAKRQASGSSGESSASSLEPLTEEFDVVLPLSPVPSTIPLPSTGAAPQTGGPRRRDKRSPAGTPQPGSGSSSPGRSTVELPRPETPTTRTSWWSREKHVGSPPGSPPSSTSPSLPPVAPSSPLIADVAVAKSRLLVTKTHVFYPPPSPLLPFQSAVLGFRVLLHPSEPKARVKHTTISLTLRGIESGPAPVIKALSPTQGHIHVTAEGSIVTYKEENNLGISLGFDPYGKLNLGTTHTKETQLRTAPFLLGSGCETSRAMITLNEDSSSHAGIPPSLDFALLLYLPDGRTSAFEADLSVESTMGGEFGGAIRRMLGSPKIWRLNYDGRTELGTLQLGGVVEIQRDHDGRAIDHQRGGRTPPYITQA